MQTVWNVWKLTEKMYFLGPTLYCMYNKLNLIGKKNWYHKYKYMYFYNAYKFTNFSVIQVWPNRKSLHPIHSKYRSSNWKKYNLT